MRNPLPPSPWGFHRLPHGPASASTWPGGSPELNPSYLMMRHLTFKLASDPDHPTGWFGCSEVRAAEGGF